MKKKKTASEQRKILAENIRKLLDGKGKTQTDMARDLGIAETTVSSWLNCERYPRIDKIQQLADYFGVYRSDITDDKKNKQVITSSQYPIYPAISAGLPIEIDGILEGDVETISVPDYLMGKWAGNKKIYFTRTNGDSMNKIIPHDSLIAVKPIESHELKDRDIVVYRNKHGEYAVKRFIRDNDRLIFKPDSTDDRFTDDVIYLDDCGDLTIKGKVVMWIVVTD